MHGPRTAAPRGGPPLFLLLVSLALAGCGGDEATPGQTAAAGFLPAAPDPSLFDSIDWDSDGAARERGATVYAYSCAICHGPTGAGDGHYQVAGRLLRTPTFLRDDWALAASLDALRTTIYLGNPSRGMPAWSEKGLTPRDTDAVARYITWDLWARHHGRPGR